MHDLTEISVDSFLDQVADRTPTPGGGSVTGLAGALACALARMVAAYSSGKDGSGSEGRVDPDHDWASRLRRADQLIRALITQDAAAYVDMTARKKEAKTAGDDPATQTAYVEAILAALSVPMEMAAVASNTLAVIDEAKAGANRYLLSDLAIAAVLAAAAARAARYTVRINALELADDSTRAEILVNADRIVERCGRHLASVEAFVSERVERRRADNR